MVYMVGDGAGALIFPRFLRSCVSDVSRELGSVFPIELSLFYRLHKDVLLL